MYTYPDLFDYYPSAQPNFNAASLAVVGGVLFFSLLIAAVLYIFGAIALYTIGKRRSMNNAYLAFIPIVNTYFLGKVADDINKSMNKKSSIAKKMLIFLIISFVAMFFGGFALGISIGLSSYSSVMVLFAVPAVLLLLAGYAFVIVLLVFEYIAMYAIFKEYSPSNAVLFIVLSIIISGIYPFLLFAIRNNKSGYEMWQEEQEEARRQYELRRAEIEREKAEREAIEVEEIPQSDDSMETDAQDGNE